MYCNLVGALQVFEMLEQFADGEESFRSDCTLVKKVLKSKNETAIPMSQVLEVQQLKDDFVPSVSDEEEMDRWVVNGGLVEW